MRTIVEQVVDLSRRGSSLMTFHLSFSGTTQDKRASQRVEFTPFYDLDLSREGYSSTMSAAPRTIPPPPPPDEEEEEPTGASAREAYPLRRKLPVSESITDDYWIQMRDCWQLPRRITRSCWRLHSTSWMISTMLMGEALIIFQRP